MEPLMTTTTTTAMASSSSSSSSSPLQAQEPHPPSSPLPYHHHQHTHHQHTHQHYHSTPAVRRPPTEAQLRWAQFHRHRVADKVAARVTQLWLQPASPSAVPGAHSDDGTSDTSADNDDSMLTTATDNESTNLHTNKNTNNNSDRVRRRRRQTPNVSRGRRALLKVSQRLYEARRLAIAEHGYRTSGDGHASSSDEDDDDSNGSDDDFLAILFSERSQRRRHQRNHRTTVQWRKQRSNNNDDDDDYYKKEKERVRRFETAFYAMMSILSHPTNPQAQQQQQIETIVATKIWTRPNGMAGGHNHVSIDGRAYSDWKLGLGTIKQPQSASTVSKVHTRTPPLPVLLEAAALGNDSSVRQQLTVMARHYLVTPQQQTDGHDNDDENDESNQDSISGRAVMEEDVRTLVNHFERRLVIGTTDEGDCIPYLDDEHHIVQVLSPTTAELIRQFEHAPNDHENDDDDVDDTHVGFVERFVANIEAALLLAGANTDANQQLVTADGKLHKPAFAKLVQQYLTGQTTKGAKMVSFRRPAVPSSTRIITPSGNEPNKSAAATAASIRAKLFPGDTTTSAVAAAAIVNDEKKCTDDVVEEEMPIVIPSFVRIFIEQLERDDQVEPVLTSDGVVNRPVLERMVHRYLEETSHRCMRSDENWSPPETVRPNQRTGSESVGIEEANTTLSSAPSVFGRIRNAHATIQNLRLGVGETGAPVAFESKQNESVRGDNAVQQTTVPTFGTKLTGSVSNKVSELFSSLNSKHSVSDEAVYSAFRLAQDKKKHGFGIDDESSQSSYHILPAGIRRVVQGFRDKRLFSTQDGDVCSEHKQESDNIFEVEDDEDGVELDTNSSGILSSEEAAQKQSGILPDHAMNLQAALKLNGVHGSDHSVIYADGDGSLISENDNDEHLQTVGSLMLSPTLITKRHQQAIRAVENRKWDHVKYLLSANPWLAEMADANTSQYVIHKLAFYGSGLIGMDHTTGEVISIRYPPSPEPLNLDLMRLFPSSVHKFDRDGNLPLHMAAASANFAMIKLLGERFSSGASVRNEDGMLPLHLVIIACASPIAATFGSGIEACDIVRTVAGFFPGALGVVDNEGNLPIHAAASVLQGEEGAAIINFILDETERQIAGSLELRFCNKRWVEEVDETAFETETIVTDTDSLVQYNESTNCLVIRNEMGQTPLSLAISSRAGWEVIEALTCTSGALQSLDSENNSALHLLLMERYQDPISVMTVMRLVPEVATLPNGNGILPIEIACMQMLPREVILALVLVDLPIHLDDKNDASIKDGFGLSWCYVSCDCDDFYVDVVEEVIGLCSFTQARALCLFQAAYKDMVLARATPKCKGVLLRALRVIGRFEFVESAPVYSDNAGVTAFNALDFQSPSDASSDGKRVLLKCFTSEERFIQKTALMSHFNPESSFFEEILTFVVGEGDVDRGPLPNDGQTRYCISIERPELTLSSVVKGMLGNPNCQNDATVRRRYTVKVFAVLRSIAKSLQQLHSNGLIHGRLCLETCGKYGDRWKLSDLLESQTIGDIVTSARLSSSAPPESVHLLRSTGAAHVASFRSDLIAWPSFDSWSFGKLTYEVLVGDSLIEFDVSKDDHDSLVRLSQWNELKMLECRRQLEQAGIIEQGISLVLQCLCPEENRLSMNEVLQHSLWLELRRL